MGGHSSQGLGEYSENTNASRPPPHDPNSEEQRRYPPQRQGVSQGIRPRTLNYSPTSTSIPHESAAVGTGDADDDDLLTDPFTVDQILTEQRSAITPSVPNNLTHNPYAKNNTNSSEYDSSADSQKIIKLEQRLKELQDVHYTAQEQANNEITSLNSSLDMAKDENTALRNQVEALRFNLSVLQAQVDESNHTLELLRRDSFDNESFDEHEEEEREEERACELESIQTELGSTQVQLELTQTEHESTKAMLRQYRESLRKYADANKQLKQYVTQNNRH